MADAHESGAKEAVTDAVKRAFRSCGNQFGISLYDKSRNIHQNQPRQQQQAQPNRQSTPMQKQQSHSHHPYDYTSLYNLGLTIMEQGNNLVVMGEDIYNKKDSIKACGFKFDAASKMWYKPVEQQAA